MREAWRKFLDWLDGPIIPTVPKSAPRPRVDPRTGFEQLEHELLEEIFGASYFDVARTVSLARDRYIFAQRKPVCFFLVKDWHEEDEQARAELGISPLAPFERASNPPRPETMSEDDYKTALFFYREDLARMLAKLALREPREGPERHNDRWS